MATAATHCVCLSSAALVFIAVLVATFTYLSHKEFIQELCHLRKDITGDGRGVQMDPNSYFHFSQQIKIHRQEIYKKEVLIKTLEKEKLINEVLCAKLKISLREAEKKLLLNNTFSTQKSNNLLTTGQLRYRKVNDKLNRKRSVDENNLQNNDEISQHFKQNFKNLEESLNLFIDSSTKFIMGLKDRIDQNLHKHYSRIIETSRIFENLEGILSNILQERDKKFSDQAYNTEKILKEFLSLARLNSDSAVNILHSYISEILLPICQNVQQSLIQHKSEMEFFHYQVRTQIQNQQDAVKDLLRMHTESLKQLKTKLELFVQKSNKAIENVRKSTRISLVMQGNLGEIFKSKIDEMKAVLHKTEEIYHQSMFSFSKHQQEVLNLLKPVLQANQITVNEFATTVQHEEKRTFDFISMLNEQADNCYSTLSESSIKLSNVLKETENFQNHLEHSTRGTVVSVIDIWKEHYNVMDKYLHKFSQNIQLELQTQYEQRQGIERKCHILERRLKAEFEKHILNEDIFVQEHIGNIYKHKIFLSDWKNIFITDLKMLDFDVNNFLYQYSNHDLVAGGNKEDQDFINSYNTVIQSPASLPEKLRSIKDYSKIINQNFMNKLVHNNKSVELVTGLKTVVP